MTLRLLYVLPAFFLAAAFAADGPINVVLIMADDVGYERVRQRGSRVRITTRVNGEHHEVISATRARRRRCRAF